MRRSQVKASTPDVAACIAGGLRTISLTALSIRHHLLDSGECRAQCKSAHHTCQPPLLVFAVPADGFLVASTGNASMPLRKDMDAIKLLGPRLVTALVGTEASILNVTLREQVAHAPLQSLYTLNVRRRETDWGWRLAGELMHVKTCYDTVRRHELRRSRKYTYFVRTRPDLQLFEPLPPRFFDLAEKDAAIPLGENFGGINDRFMVGRSHAFAADAQRWHGLLSNTMQLRKEWSAELLFKYHLRASGVVVRRRALAYCIVGSGGGCRYPGELVLSLMRLPELLRGRIQLCSTLLRRGSECDPAIFPGQPPRWVQTPGMRELDPDFCLLRARCLRLSAAARRARMASGLQTKKQQSRGSNN